MRERGQIELAEISPPTSSDRLLCTDRSAIFAALMSRAAADPPRRVVSFNVCADQLVVALADPAQIAGLSPYAADPALSVVADQARAFRRIDWQAESTIPLDPDLVLVGSPGTAR